MALQTINDFASKRTMLDIADAAVASDPAELEQAIGWLRRVHELALIRRARAA